MWERFSYYGMRALLILFMTAAPATGGLGFDTATAGAVYGLYTVDGVPVDAAGRLDRGSADRTAAGRALRRHPHRVRPLQHGRAVARRPSTSGSASSSSAPGFSRATSACSSASCTRRTTAGATPASRSTTWASTSARSSRRWCADISASGSTGTWASARPASAWCSAWSSTSWEADNLGTAGLTAAPAESPAAAAALRQSAIALGRPDAGGRSCSPGVAIGLGVVNVSAAQIADAVGYLLLIGTVAFFAWLFLDRSWTPDERGRLYVDRRVLPGRGHLLVGLRAGGIDAEPVCRSQREERDRGRTFPSSWFQSANALFIIALAPVFAWLWLDAGTARAGEPDQVRVRAHRRRARASSFSCRRPSRRRTASQVSPMWLIVTYLLHTMAELCLSPVGLELDDQARAGAHRRPDDGRLVPRRVGRQFHRGPLAGFYEEMPLSQLFGAVSILADRWPACLLLVLSARFTRMMHGAK